MHSFVCLSGGVGDSIGSNEQLSLKFFIWVGCGQGKKYLYIGKDLDDILDTKKQKKKSQFLQIFGGFSFL